jgi:nucleotide-binding universal stress UspA family protein
MVHIVIGCDGSEASRHAFEYAAGFFKPKDQVTIIHVSDPAKDQATLPFDFRSASIEDYYRTRCPSRFPSSAWRFVHLLKSSGRDTRGELISYLKDPRTQPDLLVVGMVGRKGPKELPTLIGRTSDYSLREASVSTCVCKLHVVPESVLYACAVDGSDRADLGVALVAHLKRPEDRVVLLHIEVRMRGELLFSGTRHVLCAVTRPILCTCSLFEASLLYYVAL